MRLRLSASPPDGSTRERISEAESGSLEPSCQMASAILRRTIALRDIGTLIMLASSRMASLALFWLSLSAVSFPIGDFSFPTTIFEIRE